MFRKVFFLSIVIVVLSIVILELIKPFPDGSIIVQQNGGAGNQMFQYAAAYALAKKTNSKVFILVDDISEETLARNFVLTKLSIPVETIINKESLSKKFVKLNNKLFFKGSESNSELNKLKLLAKLLFNVTYVDHQNIFELAKRKNNQILFINDHFESEIFFEGYKGDLEKLFYAKSVGEDKFSKLNEKLSQENSVCVHIRRGDKTSGIHYLPITYQKKAINLARKLIENPNFFIFSDNIELTKEELKDQENLFYISGFSSVEDFYLFQRCSHNIVANSTFSWWGAYLNQNPSKIVIAPFPKLEQNFFLYFNNVEIKYELQRLIYSTAYPKNWISIDFKNENLHEFADKSIQKQNIDIFLKDYYPSEFTLYSGDLIQLDICKTREKDLYEICIANGSLKNKTPAIVSSYYQDLPLEELKNFLSLNHNLILFTSKERAQLVKELRGELPITIIEQDNFNAEKVKLVNRAIDLNPYNTFFFVWIDISLLKDISYLNKSFPSSKYMLKNKMSFIATGSFSNEDIKRGYAGKDTSVVASNIQVGDTYSWRVYGALWNKTKSSSSVSGQDEQVILETIAIKYPRFVNLIYPDIRYKGDKKLYGLFYFRDYNRD